MINKPNYARSITKKLLDGCIAETDNGIKLFKPDGMGRYPAVWTRDFSYMVEYAGELLDKEDIYFNIEYLLSHASAEGWIPDWVRADGTVVYGFKRPEFPSTPLLDNGSFIIFAAYDYLQILAEDEANRTFLKWREALCKGIDWLPLNSDGLIEISEESLHVGYGFTDTVKKSGAMAMETLLLWRACKKLSALLQKVGFDSTKYDERARKIEQSFCKTFSTESGMINSTTGLCKQIDIFASCYMISIGFPIDESQKTNISNWLIANYDGIVESGQIRHLPVGEYWEATYLNIEKNTYQNGAYWAVATSWFYDAVSLTDKNLAKQTVLDALKYFEEFGIYECVHGEYKKLETYVVSATNVYDAVKKIAKIQLKSVV